MNIFSRKFLIIFCSNIDCGYTLEPPRFWGKNKKNRYTPATSSFTIYTLCTRDTINYLTSETDTTRRGAWRKMESGELTIILILHAFMRGSLDQELAEK